MKIKTKVLDIDTEFNANRVLIYGDNGVGKTTLSECLRKKTDALYNPKQIELSNWHNKNIHVYNRHFVDENVHNFHSTQDIKNIISVILGKIAIDKVNVLNEKQTIYHTIVYQRSVLQKQLENMNSEIHKISQDFIQKIGEEYKQLINKTLNDIALKINNLKKQLPQETESIVDSISYNYQQFQNTDIDLENIKTIMHTTIQTLSQEREDQLFHFCQFIETQKSWYKIGVDSLNKTNNLCPFCHQSLEDKKTQALIQDYKMYFENNQAQKIYSSIDNQIEKINNITNSDTLKHNEVVSQNIRLEYKLDISLKNNIIVYLKHIKNCLVEKRNNLNKQIECSIEKYNEHINLYNQSVDHMNENISSYNSVIKSQNKKREEQLVNKQNLEKQISQLCYLQKNPTICSNQLKELEDKKQELANIKEQLKQLDSKKSNCEQEIQQTSQEYKNEAEANINQYMDKINEYLMEFGFPFSIKPNITINSDRRQKAILGDVQAQYKIIREDTTELNLQKLNYELSEGEKNALGIAFFLAQLPESLQNDIIVFDDPITSFDLQRNLKTTKIISLLLSEYTLILTHSKNFASMVFSQYEGKVQCYQLERTGDNPKSCLVATEKFIEKSEFFYFFDKILTAKAEQNLDNLQKHLRNMIELIVTHAYLFTYENSTKLNEQYNLTRLNQKNPNGRNQSLMTVAKDKNILPQFINLYDTFSRSHSSNDPLTKMDDSELRNYTNEAYKLIVNYMQGTLHIVN